MCHWAIYIFPGSVYIFPPAEQADPSWEYIIHSQTHECGNWDWGPDIPFLGIYVSNFRHFVFAVYTVVQIWRRTKKPSIYLLKSFVRFSLRFAKFFCTVIRMWLRWWRLLSSSGHVCFPVILYLYPPIYTNKQYSILFYSILFYSILCYSILFYSILFYSILFYSILFYYSLFYSISREKL